MESRFRTGDKVKIGKKTRFYNDGERYNPKDMEGEITCFDDSNDIPIRVEWANNEAAWYGDNDLRLVRRQ